MYVAPILCADKHFQMTDVFRCNDSVNIEGLCSKDDVAIKLFRIRCRPAYFPRRCPKIGSFSEDWSCKRNVKKNVHHAVDRERRACTARDARALHAMTSHRRSSPLTSIFATTLVRRAVSYRRVLSVLLSLPLIRFSCCQFNDSEHRAD